jgi:hypothetical protein
LAKAQASCKPHCSPEVVKPFVARCMKQK